MLGRPLWWPLWQLARRRGFGRFATTAILNPRSRDCHVRRQHFPVTPVQHPCNKGAAVKHGVVGDRGCCRVFHSCNKDVAQHRNSGVAMALGWYLATTGVFYIYATGVQQGCCRLETGVFRMYNRGVAKVLQGCCWSGTGMLRRRTSTHRRCTHAPCVSCSMIVRDNCRGSWQRRRW